MRDLFGELPAAPEFKRDEAFAKISAPVAFRCEGPATRTRLVLRMEKRGRCAFTRDADPHCLWLWLPADRILIQNLEPDSPQWCDVTMPLALASEHGL
jgi:hypothetical protein